MVLKDLQLKDQLHFTSKLKASSMFWPVIAEVQRQRHFFQFTKASMVDIWTSLYLARSDLLPTNKTTVLGSPYASNSLNQFCRCSKERVLVRSNTIMIPKAFRQQAAVMALNLYCPAVSQICVLMIILSMMKVLMASSTPMVGLESSLKVFYVNLVRMLVLPTPESPTMMILNIKSGSMLAAMLQLFPSNLSYQTIRQHQISIHTNYRPPKETS